MKIKRFTPENSRSKSNGIASLTVSKAGAIRFSKTVKTELKLEKGDKVEFIQSKENPRDWFITKTNTGFKLRTGTNALALLFNSSTIAHEIFKSVGYTGRSARFIVAIKPTIIDDITCYAIITSSIKTLKE